MSFSDIEQISAALEDLKHRTSAIELTQEFSKTDRLINAQLSLMLQKGYVINFQPGILDEYLSEFVFVQWLVVLYPFKYQNSYIQGISKRLHPLKHLFY